MRYVMHISEVPYKKDIDCSGEIKQNDDGELQYIPLSQSGGDRGIIEDLSSNM